MNLKEKLTVLSALHHRCGHCSHFMNSFKMNELFDKELVKEIMQYLISNITRIKRIYDNTCLNYHGKMYCYDHKMIFCDECCCQINVVDINENNDNKIHFDYPCDNNHLQIINVSYGIVPAYLVENKTDDKLYICDDKSLYEIFNGNTKKICDTNNGKLQDSFFVLQNKLLNLRSGSIYSYNKNTGNFLKRLDYCDKYIEPGLCTVDSKYLYVCQDKTCYDYYLISVYIFDSDFQLVNSFKYTYDLCITAQSITVNDNYIIMGAYYYELNELNFNILTHDGKYICSLMTFEDINKQDIIDITSNNESLFIYKKFGNLWIYPIHPFTISKI